MNDKPSILIVGGGISGLSAGCYAQMNGFDATILEMHTKPGGCCTSWTRSGYTFDPCISWLNGSGNDDNDELSAVWRELNTLDEKQINHFEVFNTVRFPDGDQVKIYCDPDKLEKHLLELSPEDAELSIEFCKHLRAFRKCGKYFPFLNAEGLRTIFDKAKLMWRLLPYMKTITTTMGTRMNDFAERFSNPKLRQAMKYILFEDVAGLPMLPSCINLANAADLNAGVPNEGSLELSRSVEQRFLELGGTIRYRAKVEEILIENHCAVGVRLTKGDVLDADIVVGALDGHTLLNDLLGGQYQSDELRRIYDVLETRPDEVLFPGIVCAFIGVEGDYSDQPACSTYILEEDEMEDLVGLRNNGISVQIRNQFYPGTAPEGKSIFYISFFSSYQEWEKLNDMGGEFDTSIPVSLRRRSSIYKEHKERMGERLVQIIDRRIPGFREAIDIINIGTPLSCHRFTNNYHGTIFGWMPLTQTNTDLEDEMKKQGAKLPGLKNFYMAGHWLGNGGVTRAAHSGRHVIQYVCRDQRRKFVVKSKPHVPSVNHFIRDLP